MLSVGMLPLYVCIFLLPLILGGRLEWRVLIGALVYFILYLGLVRPLGGLDYYRAGFALDAALLAFLLLMVARWPRWWLMWMAALQTANLLSGATFLLHLKAPSALAPNTGPFWTYATYWALVVGSVQHARRQLVRRRFSYPDPCALRGHFADPNGGGMSGPWALGSGRRTPEGRARRVATRPARAAAISVSDPCAPAVNGR